MSRTEHRIDRAAQWVLAQEEADWNGEDQAALEAWLAESDGNRTSYLLMRHSWREADRIAETSHTWVDAEVSAAYRSPARWYVPVALAASLVLAIGGGYMLAEQSLPVTSQVATTNYATRVGAQRSVGLSDGSKIRLNTASMLRTAIQSDKREVWVDQGEAFFEVAHREGQPFIVHVGNRQVTVLGTKFAVRRDGDKVTVTVLEGRVRVDQLVDGSSIRSAIIAAGDIAFGNEKSTLVTSRSEQSVEDALAWREGMLSFDQRNLGEIAAEFNRYNIKKLVVTDREAASLRIGGMFPSDDPDSFLELLRDAYGLKISETPTEVRISNYSQGRVRQ